MTRVKFLRIKPDEFFEKIQSITNLTLQKLAKICEVHQRSMSDWKNGKSLMPFSVFRKLHKIGGFKCSSIKILPDHWHIKDAAKKGAFARYKIYGNPGTLEGRRKGGKTTCRKLLSNPELAKKIGFILRKKIYHPNKRSIKFAELIGILIGDGGITDYQVTVTLNKETDKEYVYFVVKLFRDLFHLKATTKERRDEKTCTIVISSKGLVEYLIKVGLKNGNKIKQQVDIPKWIKDDKKLKIACLRGLIDTDGSFYTDIHKIKNKYYFNPGIAFTTYSIPLFLSVKKILKDLNYHPTGKRNIFLRRENEVIRYFKEIGFDNPKHALKFKKFLKICRNGK